MKKKSMLANKRKRKNRPVNMIEHKITKNN